MRPRSPLIGGGRQRQVGACGRGLVLALAVLPVWDVSAHLQGQDPDEVNRASFLRWGCAGCHGAAWAGLPPLSGPGVEGLGEGHTSEWLVGYLLGDSLRSGVPHPIPFSGSPLGADSLAASPMAATIS